MSGRNTPPRDSNSGLEIFVPYAGQLGVRAGHKREGEVGLQLREGGRKVPDAVWCLPKAGLTTIQMNVWPGQLVHSN